MNRNVAIGAWQHTLDELARVSVELETVNLLIVHFRQKPTIVRRLALTKKRLEAERDRLQRMVAHLAEEI